MSKTKKDGRGRPSKYSKKIADKIIGYIISGEKGNSIHDICASDDELPAENTFFLWLQKHDYLLQEYQRAKVARTDRHLEEIQIIADESNDDLIVSNGVIRTNNTAIERAKLRIQVREKELARGKPHKYNDRYDELKTKQKFAFFVGKPEKKLQEVNKALASGRITLRQADSLTELAMKELKLVEMKEISDQFLKFKEDFYESQKQ